MTTLKWIGYVTAAVIMLFIWRIVIALVLITALAKSIKWLTGW